MALATVGQKFPRFEKTSVVSLEKGKEFESGKLGLEELREIALASGEPKRISGKQELFEMIINDCI